MKTFFTYCGTIDPSKNEGFPFCEVIPVREEEVPPGIPLFESYDEACEALRLHKERYIVSI